MLKYPDFSDSNPRIYAHHLSRYARQWQKYAGEKIADQLHYPFVDLDTAIYQKAGRAIEDIFAREGEAYFRQLEQEALLENLKHPRLVLATGGGAPCFFDNMQRINQAGISLYLRVPCLPWFSASGRKFTRPAPCIPFSTMTNSSKSSRRPWPPASHSTGRQSCCLRVDVPPPEKPCKDFIFEFFLSPF
ncbi:MAG: hypothetical protein HC880_02510 [Bacteroidia bacterium]|nr:hypothetical protein [Bacteroidia bacterium]